MTTTFGSKRSAILRAFHYAGVLGQIKPEELTWKESTISQLGVYHSIEIAEFHISKDRKVRIGIGKFRDGYELWLIDPESGFSQRV